jgi:hypothetical protein
MMEYTLPRELYDLLEEAFGQKQKAEIFAKAIESAIREIQRKASEDIVEKKEHTKIEVKEELKTELVTSERFSALETKIEERFRVVDEKFKSLSFKLNMFLAIALIALTFANPTFAKVLEKLFGF